MTRFLARLIEVAALLLFLVALCSPAHAQTVTVSGNLKNIIGGNITANAWVRLELQNCGGNWPVVSGSLLVQSRYDLKPDGAGNITQAVYVNSGTGAITCAGQATTFYNATRYLNNSAVGAAVPIVLLAGSNLSLNAPPTCQTPYVASCQLISTPTAPIAAGPVGATGPQGSGAATARDCSINSATGLPWAANTSTGTQIKACLSDLNALGGGVADAQHIFGGTIDQDICNGYAVTSQIKLQLGQGTYWVIKNGADFGISCGGNVKIEGCGQGCTVIKQVANIGNFVRTIRPQDGATKVRLAHLTLDGNLRNQSTLNQQNHAFICTNCVDPVLEDVEIINHAGDGPAFVGAISPQADTLTSITGSGATATAILSTSLGALVNGGRACIVSSRKIVFDDGLGRPGYTPSGYDSCYTITKVNATTYTFPSAVTATAAASGFIIPQNFQAESVTPFPATDGVILAFTVQLAHGQIVPGTLELTIAGNVYPDDKYGMVSGTHMMGACDYATGACLVLFDTGFAPAIAASFSASYAAGGMGFTQNPKIINSRIESTQRAEVGLFSFRHLEVSGTTFAKYTNGSIQDLVHYEPDSNYQWCEGADLHDNWYLTPGLSIYGVTAGGQADQGDNCSDLNVHDNHFLGATLNIGRFPNFKANHNFFKNSARFPVIQIAARDGEITNNDIDGYAPNTFIDGSAGAISVVNTSPLDLSGEQPGTGRITISGNHVKNIPGFGISVVDASKVTIVHNHISRIKAPIALAYGIKVAATEQTIDDIAHSGCTRTSNVATCKTGTAGVPSNSGFSVGQQVYLKNVSDSTFNGVQVLASIPTAHSFTFTNVGADVPVTTAGGGSAAIYVHDNTVAINQVFDDAATPTLLTGIYIGSSVVNTALSTNTMTDAATAQCTDLGTGTVKRGNIGGCADNAAAEAALTIPNAACLNWRNSGGTQVCVDALSAANNFVQSVEASHTQSWFIGSTELLRLTYTPMNTLFDPSGTLSLGETTTFPFQTISTKKIDSITDTGVVTNLNADAVGNVHQGTITAGKAVCFKDATHFGVCSTVVAADGSCTCN